MVTIDNSINKTVKEAVKEFGKTYPDLKIKIYDELKAGKYLNLYVRYGQRDYDAEDDLEELKSNINGMMDWNEGYVLYGLNKEKIFYECGWKDD